MRIQTSRKLYCGVSKNVPNSDFVIFFFEYHSECMTTSLLICLSGGSFFVCSHGLRNISPEST